MHFQNSLIVGVLLVQVAQEEGKILGDGMAMVPPTASLSVVRDDGYSTYLIIISEPHLGHLLGSVKSSA